jgi:hypothetical protein
MFYTYIKKPIDTGHYSYIYLSGCPFPCFVVSEIRYYLRKNNLEESLTVGDNHPIFNNGWIIKSKDKEFLVTTNLI